MLFGWGLMWMSPLTFNVVALGYFVIPLAKMSYLLTRFWALVHTVHSFRIVFLSYILIHSCDFFERGVC